MPLYLITADSDYGENMDMIAFATSPGAAAQAWRAHALASEWFEETDYAGAFVRAVEIDYSTSAHEFMARVYLIAPTRKFGVLGWTMDGGDFKPTEAGEARMLGALMP